MTYPSRVHYLNFIDYGKVTGLLIEGCSFCPEIHLAGWWYRWWSWTSGSDTNSLANLEIIAVDAGVQPTELSLRQPVGVPNVVTDVPGSDREKLVAGGHRY
jgi:hypothetical protein